MVIAPAHPREEERLASLVKSSLLDTPRDRDIDRLIFTIAQAFRVPIATLTLIDANRQWFKSAVGLEVTETSRDVAFCAHTIIQSDVLVVEDTTQDIRFRDNPLVVHPPSVRFYAGAPVLSTDGLPLGSLCIVDRTPRHMTKHEVMFLKQLAHEAEILIQRFQP